MSTKLNSYERIVQYRKISAIRKNEFLTNESFNTKKITLVFKLDGNRGIKLFRNNSCSSVLFVYIVTQIITLTMPQLYYTVTNSTVTIKASISYHSLYEIQYQCSGLIPLMLSTSFI